MRFHSFTTRAPAGAAAILFAMLAGAPAGAEPTGAAFLKLTPSARAYALGNARGVSTAGAQALTGNPAQLGVLPGEGQFFSSFFQLVAEAQYANLALARRTAAGGPITAYGVGLTHLRVEGPTGRDMVGNVTDADTDARDTALAAGVSGVTPQRLRWGVTGKILRSQIGGFDSDTGWAADLGVAYDTTFIQRTWTVGASVNNLGRGLRFLSQRAPLPATIQSGLSTTVGPAVLLLDARHPLYEGGTTIGAGVEYNLGPVALRAGYRSANGPDNLALEGRGSSIQIIQGFTTGLGLQVGAARLDYALGQELAEFGLSHRAAITWTWGSVE